MYFCLVVVLLTFNFSCPKSNKTPLFCLVWCIFQHKTVLCKTLLQEYAQTMNFVMSWYEYQRHETKSKMIKFSCTIDIGGMKYIGVAARSKESAEIKIAQIVFNWLFSLVVWGLTTLDTLSFQRRRSQSWHQQPGECSNSEAKEIQI